MAFIRPTLTEIITRIEADMSARLLNGAPVLRRSFLGVLARVFAGISHLLYGFLEWMSKQIVPGAETNDSDMLEQHADLWGVARRAAAYATGNITVTGTTGAVIPAGSVLQSAAGIQYKTDTETILDDVTAEVAVTAVEAGTAGNLDAAAVVSFVSAIDGVNSSATVATGGLAGGVAEETIAELRARLVERLRNTPHGGSLADYERWALEVAGVSKVFVFPLYNQPGDIYPAPGHVGVTFITAAGGIPGAGTVAALQSHLNEVAPSTAQVTAYAPAALTVDFEIQYSPYSASESDPVRLAIAANLAALFLRVGAPNATIPLSQINEAISAAVGEDDHVLVAPVANITTTRAQYPVVGTISFSELT